MSKKLPIFYSALLLTGVNLLLRLVGTSFQVFLSSRIGAEGIGLMQLVMSISMMATVAGMAGARTASMYLTAEELGRGCPGNIRWILSGCIHYSIVCSGISAVSVFHFAPFLAEHWIGDPLTASSIRLFSVFLPVNCLTGVMAGYFTGANRIGTLAAVEVAEQAACMLCSVMLLSCWAGNEAVKCCQAVVMGNGLGSCLTLLCLLFLRLRQHDPKCSRIPVARRLADVAIPLALADDLKTGINTVENLIVPKRLALYGGITTPLAAFGTVSGMVFPILMFPACVLYGLAELLIPELARCAAANSKIRVRYLVKRSLKVAMLYGLTFGGLEFLTANALCLRLYNNVDAGIQLRLYALMIPMLYCDTIVDAMTKGLGQQKACVRYNIITSAMDVIFLYILLPKHGMIGYYISFLITHLINFLLSLGRLLKITDIKIPWYIPLLSVSASAAAVTMMLRVSSPVAQAILYPIALACLLCLLGILRIEDLQWLKGLVLRR